MKFCSIIITHYHKDEERADQMRASLASLTESTNYPLEIIVIDNGNNLDDSQFFLELVHKGTINTYIRNHKNMHFGYARNQGLAIANGDYICIADNDILYGKGWLEACIAVLEAYPDKKIYATPVYNVAHWLDKFWTTEVLQVNGKTYRLNARAGSNCFVVRKKDFEEVGRFLCHRVAGTKWTEKAISKGYFAAVTPEIMINDLGFRTGYNYKEMLPITIKLSTGEEVCFNEDEYKYHISGIHRIQQGSFNPENNPRPS